MPITTNYFYGFVEIVFALIQLPFFLVIAYFLLHYKDLKEVRHGALLSYLFITCLLLIFVNYLFEFVAFLLAVYMWIQILRLRRKKGKDL